MTARPSAEQIDALWDFERPQQSEGRFRVLLERVGDGTEAGAEILTQIARAEGLQQRFEDAHRTLDDVEPLLGEAHASRLRARYLLERGRVLNSSGHQSAALPLFIHALGVATATGEDFYAVDAAHMIAIVCAGEESIGWNRRGLAMVDASPNPRVRRWRGSLYNNMGWIHHDRGEFDDALRCFEQALQARGAQGDEGLIRIARWCVARGLRSVGRAADALAIQEALLAEHKRLGTDAGEVYEEIIACLEMLGRHDEAESVRRESGSVASEAAGDNR
jgi:tetratricopeptide (TPR) repeat protein